MSLDNFKNNAKVTVSTGYDNVATSVVLQAGDGAKLPTVPFNAEWWNSTDYPDPTDDPNRELIRVTTISTDTLTIVRAQEGNSAQTHNTAAKVYKLIAGLTAKTLNTDIPATYTAYNATMTTAGGVAYVSGSGTITEDAAQLFWNDANVELGIGTATPAGIIHAVGTVTGAANAIIVDSFQGNSQVLLRRADGTPGSPTAVQSGDLIARFGMQGHNGSAFTARKAAIEMNAAENWGTASNGAYISIQTTPKGSTTIGEVVRISDAGFVGIGTGTPAVNLHVYGTGGGGVVLVDGNTNPALALANSGTIKAYIAIPTAAGSDILDSGTGDLCIRAETQKILESVDAGASCRRMVRPAKILTSTATQTTTMFSVTAANNTVASGQLWYCVEAFDTTNHHFSVENGMFQYHVGNNNGVITSTSATPIHFLGNSEALNMTVTWGITSANPGVITCAIVLTYTPTSVKITTTIENFTRQAISPQ